jgi:putative Mg2+ transporter-C (MgtC) family protein
LSGRGTPPVRFTDEKHAMTTVIAAVHPEYASIPVVTWAEVVGRLAIAGAFGASMGLERQIRGRAAGLRTMMLVSLGCCLVMLLSNAFAQIYGRVGPREETLLQIDPARLAYSVMGGIGFLGAGAIIKSGFSIRGLTTAATIWCAAAVGMAVGMGLYLHAIATSAMVLLALLGLDRMERLLQTKWYKTLEVVLPDQAGIVQEFAAKMTRQAAQILDIDMERRADGSLRATYSICLPDRDHTVAFFDAIAREPEVRWMQLR